MKLEGVKSNRSAIGARVRVTAGGLVQTAEVRSGGSYLSQSDLRLHFGLGGGGEGGQGRDRLAGRRNAGGDWHWPPIGWKRFASGEAQRPRHARVTNLSLPSVNMIVRFAATFDHDCVSPAGQRTSMRSTFSDFPSPK